jgi:hypothetical protein
MHTHIRWLALSALICGYLPVSASHAQTTTTGGIANLARSAAVSSAAAGAAAPSVLAPFKAGDLFFNMDASGTLQVRDGERGAPRVLLPPGTFSVVAPSPNGRYLAYAVPIATSGVNAGTSIGTNTGATEIRIRNVQTGRDLPDVLHRARISPAPWSHDNKGFLYVREDSAGGRERVYYHGLGRAEAKDALILSQFDHPEWRYAARVSDDGHYAVFTISYPADSHTRIYFIDLADAGKPNFGAPVVKLAQAFDARYEFVDNAGSYFFLQTDRGAPLGRILLANTDAIREARWPSLIPESGDTLLYARTAGDEYLIAVYRSAPGRSVARVYGPQDPAILRAEIRQRIDSLKKAREKDDDRRSTRGMGPRGFMDNGPAIRLDLRAELPIPAGADIVALNSVADDQQLFYTVRLSDGTMQSFMYDVKKSRNERYPTTAVSSAAAVSPASPASPSNSY